MSIQRSRSMQGPHVRIRPWLPSDDAAMQEWPSYTDPFSPLWNLPRPVSLKGDFFSFFSSHSGTRQVWAIEDTFEQIIGRLSLRDIEQWRRRARLGISMNALYVGRGIGTEALTVFLDHFFGPFHFMTMYLDVAACNLRAIRCYDHLGFQVTTREWRRTRNTSCLKLLEKPEFQEMQPFFRHDSQGYWVQYLEMELQKSQWQPRTPRVSNRPLPSRQTTSHFSTFETLEH